MGNNVFTLASFFYSILLTISYFSKKRIGSYENKLYEKIVILNIISALFALATYYTIKYSVSTLIILLCSKGLLLVYFFWLTQLTKYVYVMTHPIEKNKNVIIEFKKIRQVMNVCVAVFLIAIIILPINYNFNGNNIFTSGPSANITFIGAGIYWVLWMLFIVPNIKKIEAKKSLIPIFVIMLSMPFILILQKINPALLLTTFLEGFATMVMYFTIENPDLQMLKEFHKAKEFNEESNTEKVSFLFNMSNQIKEPIMNIGTLCSEALNEENNELVKEDLRKIKSSSNELLSLVDNVLDVSELERRKIDIRGRKYNVYNLFSTINKSFINELDKNIEYRFNYDNSIPEYLYGDSLRLKQVMNILLDNARDYTKEGFIELNVNHIIKYDVCRLIITVEDSGMGIESEKLKHLFDKDKIYSDDSLKTIDDAKENLGMLKSLVNLMNGTVMVNSEYGKGSKFTITIDQKIKEEKTKVIEAVEKYEELYENKEKVLLVTDEEDIQKEMKKLLKKYDIDLEIVEGGQDCLEKIRNKEKYDMILIEDELPKLSSEDTLIKLNELGVYKIPIIVLTTRKEFGVEEEFIKKGFSDIIKLPIKKEEIKKVMNKYLEK